MLLDGPLRHLLLLYRVLVDTLWTHCCYTGCYWMVPYATYCCYRGCYWILCELLQLLLYVMLLGELNSTHCYCTGCYWMVCTPLLAVMKGEAKTFDTRCLTRFFYC